MSAPAPAQPPAGRFRRILLGLDPDTDDPVVLHRVAALAERLHAEIRGVFIDDDSALALADHPAVRIVSTVTATAIRLDRATVERSRRGRVAESRQAVARVMAARRVTAVFDVRRGGVADELVAASRDADLIILGWGSRGFGRRYPRRPARPGSVACAVAERAEVPVMLLMTGPASGPTVVAYDGTPAGRRALDAALDLAVTGNVVVALLSDRPAEAEAWRQDVLQAPPPRGTALRFVNLPAGNPAALVAATRQLNATLLAIGIADQACCGAPLRTVLDHAGCSLLLVR